MEKTFNVRVKQKRDTADNWSSKDPILLNGEIIFVDTAEGELRMKIGDGKSVYTQLSYVDSPRTKSTIISLLAANWTGDASPYTQVVTIDGITSTSKIDIQPTPTQLVELQDEEITLLIANDGGVATAYAINYKPTTDYEMQVLITEVETI